LEQIIDEQAGEKLLRGRRPWAGFPLWRECSGELLPELRRKSRGRSNPSRLPKAAKHGIPATGIADAALFLATEDSGWMAGVEIPVDGGFGM
jgi:NAD(P)-dependent dehydrogenase (short-subunit alcohol dehydrogenase family)